MAKASAICRCKTCGNEFTATAIKYNRREADKWEEWAPYHLFECDDCAEKRIKAEREAEAQKCAELAKEADLPALTGSPKQVAWAEQIRMKLYLQAGEFIEKEKAGLPTYAERHPRMMEKHPDAIERIQAEIDDLEAFTSWLFSKSDSKFWIDKRYDLDPELVGIYGARSKFYKEFEKEYVPADVAKEMQQEEQEKNVILEPERKESNTVCTVTYSDQAVMVKSDYDPAMPPVVKAHEYKWDGSTWGRKISFMTGAAEDRAVEIANALLIAGFPVKIDKSIADRAVNGDYIPEHKRWIKYNADKKIFFICFEDNADIEKKARRLTGAPYYGLITVPESSWEEVEEFARMHDFRLSPIASEGIEKLRNMTVKTPVKAGDQAVYAEEGLKAILDSSRDVLEDLKDDD